MTNKILGTALTFLTARSPRLRKYAPLIPLGLGLYAFIKKHRADKAAMTPATAH